jgi:hypothetical protein
MGVSLNKGSALVVVVGRAVVSRTGGGRLQAVKSIPTDRPSAERMVQLRIGKLKGAMAAV